MDTTPEERKKFVNDNLVDLCKEIVEYDTTFVYKPDAKLRELIKLFNSVSNARLLAEGLVRSCAVEHVATL